MHLFKNLLLLFLILTSTSPLVKEPQDSGPWEFAGWYGGGCYTDIQFDPAHRNRLYLASDVAGIWRSDDLGESWHFINKGLENFTVVFLALAPSDSTVLYAGTKDGLYRSKNEGASWELCDRYKKKIFFKRPENYRSAAVSFENPAKLVIGTATGEVLYSEDYGNHWRPMGNVEQPFFKETPITVVVWAPDEKFLYAASSQGLAKFSFEKTQWEYSKSRPKEITDLIISKKSPGTLYVAGNRSLWISRDSGKSWEETAPLQHGVSYRLVLLESKHPEKAPKIIVAWNEGWKGRVVFSKDGGKSWIQGHQEMFSDKISNPTRVWAGVEGRINALQADPFNSETLFLTDWWGVWRSDDGGHHWHEKIKGAPNTVGTDINITPDGEIYVATMDDGLLKSADAGKSYAAVYPAKGYDRRINGHVWSVRRLVENKLIATASPWYDQTNQIVLVNAKDGRFQVIRKGLPGTRPKVNTMWEEGHPRALAVDPKDPKKIYLGIDGNDGGGLYISNNSGNAWEYSKGQPASRRIFNALAVDPTDSNRIFWGAYSETDDTGGIYISENQGTAWKKVFDEMKKVFNLVIAEDGTIYAVGDEKGPAIYVSKDHGKNWKLLNRFPDEGAVICICLVNQDLGKIAVGTAKWQGKNDGEVYISEDGGIHWENMMDNLPLGTGVAAIAYNLKDSCLYVSQSAGSVYKRKWS